MKTCDVCKSKLGVLKFRHRDGFLCSKCYEVTSRGCTEIIRQLSLPEIKERWDLREPSLDFEEFEITGRIGNYILMDDKRGKICIINNRFHGKEYKRPEVISLKDIRYCKVSFCSSLSWEEMQKAAAGSRGYASSLGLDLHLNSGTAVYHIRILSSPVRVKSFAFRKSLGFLQRIIGYLESNHVECRWV